MSDIKRVQSVTVKDYVQLRRRGHDTSTFIAEYNEDSKKQECEIRADYGRRVITIKHLDSGDITELAFEACNQWNPYPPGKEPEEAPVKAAARKAG